MIPNPGSNADQIAKLNPSSKLQVSLDSIYDLEILDAPNTAIEVNPNTGIYFNRTIEAIQPLQIIISATTGLKNGKHLRDGQKQYKAHTNLLPQFQR